MNGQQVRANLKSAISKIGAGISTPRVGKSEDTLKMLIFTAAAVLLSCCRLYSLITPLFYPFAAYVLICEKRFSASVFSGVLVSLFSGGIMSALRLLITLVLLAFLPKLKKDKLSVANVSLCGFAVVTLSGVLFTYIQGFKLLDALRYASEGVFFMSLYPIFLCGINAAENVKNKVVFTSQDTLCFCAVTAAVVSGFSSVSIAGVNFAFMMSSYLIFVGANCINSTVALSYAALCGICLTLFAGFPFVFVAVMCIAAFLAELFAPISKIVSVFAYTAAVVLGVFLTESAALLASAIACVISAAAFFISYKKVTALIDSYRRRSSTLPGLYKEAVEGIIKNEIGIQKSMLTEVARNLNTSGEDEESSIPRLICRTLSADVCIGCVQYTRCWKSEADDTLRCFTEVVQRIMTGDVKDAEFADRLASRCSKAQIMRKTIAYIYDGVRIKHSFRNKLIRFKKLLNMQYLHLNTVLDRLYNKLAGGIYVNTYDAEAALSAIQNEGIPAEKLYIIEDFDHRRHATVKATMPISLEELKHDVADMISDATGADLAYDYTLAGEKIEGEYTYQYSERFNYCLSTGYAAKNKDGNEVSGDSCANKIISNGMQVLAVCDGMGSGEPASRQSCRVLDMLEELLNAGYDEAGAIEMINSILVLDDASEIFATLDIFIFDLNRGLGEFIKAGAAPSFIKRTDKEKIETINFDSLPVGILEETHIKNTMAKFSKGDFVYLMSDGYFECVGNDAKYVRSKIKQFAFRNPQKIADALLTDALSLTENAAVDDISVMVIKVRG